MKTNKRIILASQSPRRHELIKKLNIEFDVILPTFEEKLSSDDYSDEIIKNLSLSKALSVLENKISNSLVISADTVVVFENKIFGKPTDEKHAKKMLQKLSGNIHVVVTSVSVIDSDTKKSITKLTKTFVTFQKLSDELIDKYIKEKRPLDKAGAYGIQEMGEEFIKNVDGELDNVIGLPTKTLKNILEEFGYL